MCRKEIKAILEKYDYKMIKPSWYLGDPADNSALFIAYDECGNCYQFYVDWGKKRASRQLLSTVVILDRYDVGFMFFKEEQHV